MASSPRDSRKCWTQARHGLCFGAWLVQVMNYEALRSMRFEFWGTRLVIRFGFRASGLGFRVEEVERKARVC